MAPPTLPLWPLAMLSSHFQSVLLVRPNQGSNPRWPLGGVGAGQASAHGWRRPARMLSAPSRDYAAIVFFANNRFETGKKKLQYLSFGDFAYCAELMIQNWTLGAGGEPPPAPQPDLGLWTPFHPHPGPASPPAGPFADPHVPAGPLTRPGPPVFPTPGVALLGSGPWHPPPPSLGLTQTPRLMTWTWIWTRSFCRT